MDTTTHIRGWNGILPDRIGGCSPAQLNMFAENLGTNTEIAQVNVAAEQVLSTALAPLDGVSVPPVGQDIASSVATPLNPDGSVLRKDGNQRVHQINYPKTAMNTR